MGVRLVRPVPLPWKCRNQTCWRWKSQTAAVWVPCKALERRVNKHTRSEKQHSRTLKQPCPGCICPCQFRAIQLKYNAFLHKCPPRPLCCAVLKYTWYVFNCALCGRQRALKQKPPTAEKRESFSFARRQDAEIPGVFQERQHSKTEQFTPAAAHCALIVLFTELREINTVLLLKYMENYGLDCAAK